MLLAILGSLSLWSAADSVSPARKSSMCSLPSANRGSPLAQGSNLSWIQVHMPYNTVSNLVLFPASPRRHESFSSLFSALSPPGTSFILSCPLVSKGEGIPQDISPNHSRTSLLYFQSLCPLLNLSSLPSNDLFKFLPSFSYHSFLSNVSILFSIHVAFNLLRPHRHIHNPLKKLY